jgi:hypothetical protein
VVVVEADVDEFLRVADRLQLQGVQPSKGHEPMDQVRGLFLVPLRWGRSWPPPILLETMLWSKF